MSLIFEHSQYLLEQECSSLRCRLEQGTEFHNERMRPFNIMRPKLYIDGDMFCALYGENIQEGLCAFGETAAQCSINFDIAWLNYRPGFHKGVKQYEN